MLLAIGLFAFSIPTLAHDELQRRSAWKHATSPRIGARDATQYVGPGEETIAISGTAYAELCDGAASLDQLRTMANAGDAWPVVDGAGRVFGAYVIQTIDEGYRHLLPDGTPLKIDFTVNLLRVDDEAQS
ncbi:phage tail protein [Sphingomonas melonis]|uniref:phage tail protein n=1 Tax=Sphingomonas melonis TaxID=152682 RepID=UPI000BE3FA12|nr:phage tail protein [Sphingomonas melonis]ATI54491.1 oxidoreductase [Sphingomonas melonis]